MHRKLANSIQRRRNGRRKGLTLVELVVVMVLLLFIGLAVGGLVRSVQMTESSIMETAEINQTGRVVLQRMIAELSSALPLPVPVEEATLLLSPAGIEGAMDATATPTVLAFYHEDAIDSVLGLDMDTLRFTTTHADPRRSPTPQADVVEVAYFVDTDPQTPEQGLVRSEGTLPGLLPEDALPLQTPTEVLSDRIVSLNFRFYDPDTGEWLETWDLTDVLPALVEVRVGVAPVSCDEFLARAERDQGLLTFVEWFTTTVPIRVRSYPDPSVQQQQQQQGAQALTQFFGTQQPPSGERPSPTQPSAPSPIPQLPPMQGQPQRPPSSTIPLFPQQPQQPPSLSRPSTQQRPSFPQGQPSLSPQRPTTGTRPQGGGRR